MDLRDVAAKASVTLQALATMTDVAFFKSLYSSKHNRTRKTCWHCSAEMRPRFGGDRAQRCNRKSCGMWNYPYHGHPVLQSISGHNASLRTQLSIWHCAAWGVPGALVPALVKDATRRTVQNVYTRWEEAVVEFVEKRQLHIVYAGRGQPRAN